MLQSQRFITASCPLLLFRRFDYWMRVRLDYRPLRIHSTDVGRPSRAHSFGAAVAMLGDMVTTYSSELGWFVDDPVGHAGIDLDVISVFPPTSALEGSVTERPQPPADLRLLAAGHPALTAKRK